MGENSISEVDWNMTHDIEYEDLARDASGNDGICFWLRGSGHRLRVKIATVGSFWTNIVTAMEYIKYTNLIPYYIRTNTITNYIVSINDDWNYYGYDIPFTPGEWAQFFFKFSDLEREPGWGHREGPGFWGINFDISHITRIEFHASSQEKGEQGWIEIDYLFLFKED